MTLALLALALLALALAVPAVASGLNASPRRRRRPREAVVLRDPGRERRAEQRARELLRSCVNEEEWAMYRDLGFVRVFGRSGRGPRARSADSTSLPVEGRLDEAVEDDPVGTQAYPADPPERDLAAGREALTGPHRSRGAAPGEPGGADTASSGHRYAYLIYPHKPILAYDPRTRRLLSEYCIEFPDLGDAVTGSRLPDSDDVLAKWMALTGDEQRLLRDANMHLPGRQLDPGRVRRDLWRLEDWERRRRRSPHAPRR